jgi:hypothetical protein
VRGEPLLDRWCLVRRAVVEHEVDVEMVGDLTIDCREERLELDRAVALVQRADDLARSYLPRTNSGPRGRK